MTTKTITWLITRSYAGLMLAVVGTSFAAAPTPLPPGNHLSISSVLVEFVPDHIITIKGERFDFGSPLVVTFDDSGPLTIRSANATEIVVECPPDQNFVPLCLEGDYLLVVSNGIGQSQNDEYDLTIGAVGPRGPMGETGPIGPRGPQGETGPRGDPGVIGDQGATGAGGPMGSAGGAVTTRAVCVPAFQPGNGGCTVRRVDCGCGGSGSKLRSIVDGPCKVTSDAGSCEVTFGQICNLERELGSCCVCRD